MNRTFDIIGKVGNEQAFRQEIRDWLAATVDAGWRKQWQSVREEELRELIIKWLEQRRTVGLATPHWPKEWGGPGLPFSYQIMVYEEFARADAPELDMFTISLFHTPATLFEHGTQQQKDRYLRGITHGSDIWVQGFSEPGAGSDLASLRNSAVRQGDHYVVNGSKLWCTGAQVSDLFLVLVRLDAAPGMRGVGALLIERDTPGFSIGKHIDLLGLRGTGMAEFVVEEEVLEFDLDTFYEIDEIDCFIAVFVEENIDIETVLYFVVAIGVVCSDGWVIFRNGHT